MKGKNSSIIIFGPSSSDMKSILRGSSHNDKGLIIWTVNDILKSI